jgi:hypothetical protein
LENIFLAAKGESSDADLNTLFNGQPDSPLYPQLLLAYRIQKFVTEQRLVRAIGAGFEFLLHSDEIMSYGVFLELERNDSLSESTDNQIEAAYEIALTNVQTIVATEQVKRAATYSHARYFKSDGAIQDYDQLI